MLTSDAPNYQVAQLSTCSVFIATPEKIDSMFRSIEQFKELASRISLVMIDEIHTISDQIRGATLEAVATRLIKTSHPRIIAVSATCPNVSDVSLCINFNQ